MSQTNSDTLYFSEQKHVPGIFFWHAWIHYATFVSWANKAGCGSYERNNPMRARIESFVSLNKFLTRIGGNVVGLWYV